MKDEHKIDQMFRKGLEEPEFPFQEKDWEAMVKKLDKQEKNRIRPFWWFAGAGIAASLLILFFIYAPDRQQTKELKLTVKKDKGIPVAEKGAEISDYTRALPGKPGRDLPVQHLVPEDAEPALAFSPATLLPASLAGSAKAGIPLPGPEIKGDMQIAPVEQLPLPAGEAKENKATSRKRRPVSLSILAAPDISTTSTSFSSKVSSNLGITVSYPLTTKLTISTGVIYAKKLYNYSGAGSTDSAYPTSPWEVNADCKVLDIPVNLGYQVLKKQKISVVVNGGLSSYLMLNEKYERISGSDRSSSLQEFSNRNQHLLGVANLSVSVERKISTAVSISIQPFVKIPLTGIGSYNSNLKSSGLAVSLSFGM